MPIPVHELQATEKFRPVLGGHETVVPAGERFHYNNGGYVVLVVLAERATGTGFHLPVIGNGGIYSTAADLSALWDSFSAGWVVSTGHRRASGSA